VAATAMAASSASSPNFLSRPDSEWSTGQAEMMALLRGLTEHRTESSLGNIGSGGGCLVTTVPIELLSEWALNGLHEKDCAQLGCALTIAAACGHSLDSL